MGNVKVSVEEEVVILMLRDVVVCPHMVIPLFVGRKKSVEGLKVAIDTDKKILLVAQKNPADDDPSPDSVYTVGTVATILQMLRLPDGTVKVLVEGLQRARVKKFITHETYLAANIEILAPVEDDTVELQVLKRSVLDQFEQFVKLSKKIPQEILVALASVDDADRLADTIATHMPIKLEEKQKLLEVIDPMERLELLLGFIEVEMDLFQIEKRVRGRVKRKMEKSQREYYINEQIRALQEELGGGSEDTPNEMEQLAHAIEKRGLPKDAKRKAKADLNKLKMTSPMSPEWTSLRTYLDWIVNLPWKKRSPLTFDLKEAEDSLNLDHYGLQPIKERILEYLAVQQRVKKLKGPILCLVGPPGVGKTSLGQSIAKATGRKFLRAPMGGVRDEAEIRGHRRTYVGAMPGKIMQQMSKFGEKSVKNPLFMLDEIDKMAMDFRGDPASALLEVLDPEQNHAFNDHYLEVDYDLSEVMFIATANSLNIPGPLLDRMEVIRIPGYTEEEKVHIATRHLLPKQIKQNGLKSNEIDISEVAILEIIRYYTREAGVRNLEREIAKICRKVVRELLIKPSEKPLTIKLRNLEKYLGVKRFRYGLADSHDQIGQVHGLAWTEFGGELLTIEAATIPGKGKATYTGQLGEVMQESIQAALTVVRSRAAQFGIADDFHEKNDIHVHVPEGATPKDGPSAGIGMCTALVSALAKIPVRADVAMTGEITLRGEVLPIGGLKEKLLAAHRGGIRTVIIPQENKRDLKEVPKNIKQGLDIRPVRWMDEVLTLALQYPPGSSPAADTAQEEAPK
jgi:ATP-dependent Lon protease